MARVYCRDSLNGNLYAMWAGFLSRSICGIRVS